MKSRRRNENFFNEFPLLILKMKKEIQLFCLKINANKEEEFDKILEFNEQKQEKLENIKIEDLIKDIKDPNLMDNYSEEIDTSCPLFKEKKRKIY